MDGDAAVSDEDIERHRDEISLERVLKFFGMVGVSSDCPICKASSWGIHSIQKDHNYMIPRANESETASILPKRSMRVFLVECTNCGFVRPHSLSVYRKWEKANFRD